MPRPKQSILFVSGGTGGHLYPLLAVARACTEITDFRAIYVGTAADLRLPSVMEYEYPLEKYAIHSGKLHRYITIRQASEFSNLTRGLFEAQRLLAKLRPSLVFAKGSAVSVPVVLAAARLRIPICTHETDVIPGLANKIGSRFAETVFTAFPVENYINIDAKKLRYVGQPLRAEFYTPSHDLPFIDGRQVVADKSIITVTGGSQGARGLNAMVAEQWGQYLERGQLVHQVGFHSYGEFKARADALPARLRENLFLTEYIPERLPGLFQMSQVVISRSGGTIAELAASSSVSVLVPLPTSAQDHQRANAHVLEKVGAARVVQEVEGGLRLWQSVKELIEMPQVASKLSKNIHTFARPEAAQTIAKALISRLDRMNDY